MKLYNFDGSEYIDLERRTLRILRRYFLHCTKKHIAACCGIAEATYARVENVCCGIRRETFRKVIQFFYNSLRLLGWKEVENDVQ